MGDMSSFETAGARKAGLAQMIRQMDAAQGDVRDNGFTLGWDIIASYSEKEINQLLADRYDKSDRMVKQISGMETKIKDPKTRKWTTRYYTLNFDAPLVQFHGSTAREPSCELIMPITSGFFQEQPAGKPLDEEQYPITDEGEKLILSLSGIPLGTVKGRYSDIKDKANANNVQDVKTGSNVVKFEKPQGAKGETAYVVLNLPLGHNVDVTIRPENPSADVNEDARILEGPLLNYFKDPTKIDVIEYSVARINNYPDPNGVANNLRPESFQMATFSSSAFPASILSLFIHVQGGQDAGEKNDLQQKWAGQWVDKRINVAPIPKGYTASLILNPDLVYSELIRKGMEKDGSYRCIEKRRKDRQQGITWDVTRLNKWTTYFQKINYRQNNDDSVLEIDGFTKDFKDDPLTIDLKQPDFESGPHAHVKWSFTTRSKWEDVSRDTKWWNFGSRALYTSGEVETTWVLDKDFPCTVSMTDEAFKLDIDTESETAKSSAWRITNKHVPDSGSWTDFMVFDPPQSAINKMYDQISSVSPRLDIEAMGLGVLRTTNLLLPGEKVINFDRESGVRIPRDLVLVGDVVKSNNAGHKLTGSG